MTNRSTVRHVAFLRGMNLGGRRITNQELCALFVELGFDGVAAFLASGNVVFDAPRRVAAATIEEHVRTRLDYDVPTFLRTAAELVEIAARAPFGAKQHPDGKPQVAFLRTRPSAAARRRALQFATDDDLLAVQGAELHWWPRGRLTDSELDLRGIERELGPLTVRTSNTVQRLVAKFLA